MDEKRPRRPADEFSLITGERPFGVGNLAGEANYLAPQEIVPVSHRWAKQLRGHLNGGLGSVATLERSIDREIHRRVEQY